MLLAGLLSVCLVRADELPVKPAERLFEASALTPTRTNGFLFVNSEPFTGVLVERYEDHSIKSKSHYLNGRQEGMFESWFPNGQAEEIRQYKDGWKEGEHKGWWPDGKQRFIINFKHGVNDGICQEWHANGQLYRLNHFAGGEEVGAQRLWYEDGKVLANYVVKDGRRYGLTGAMGCVSVMK